MTYQGWIFEVVALDEGINIQCQLHVVVAWVVRRVTMVPQVLNS